MSSERSAAIQILRKFHEGGWCEDRDLERALGIGRTAESRHTSLASLLHRFGNQNFAFGAIPFHALRDIFHAIRPRTTDLFCDAGAGYGHVVLYGASIVPCRFRAIEILPSRCRAMGRAVARLGLDNVEIIQGDALRQSYADVSYLLLNNPFFPAAARQFVDHLALSSQGPLTVIALHNIVDTFRSTAAFSEIDLDVDMPSYCFGAFRPEASKSTTKRGGTARPAGSARRPPG